MTFYVDGTTGLTFNNGTTQNSAGQVLQVVNATYATNLSTSSTSPVTTGLTATITPKFSTSKFLVTTNGFLGGPQTANIYCYFVRNSTVLTNAYYGIVRIGQEGQSEYECQPFSYQYLDSPATTSAVTYKTQISNAGNTGTVYAQAGPSTSTITLLEIAA